VSVRGWNVVIVASRADGLAASRSDHPADLVAACVSVVVQARRIAVESPSSATREWSVKFACIQARRSGSAVTGNDRVFHRR